MSAHQDAAAVVRTPAETGGGASDRGPRTFADLLELSDVELWAEGGQRVSAAAKFCGLSQDAIRDEMARGVLPYRRYRGGGALLIPTLALRLWLADGTVRRDQVAAVRPRRSA